jgi:tetratricopeptide (TPR) repeat protein
MMLVKKYFKLMALTLCLLPTIVFAGKKSKKNTTENVVTASPNNSIKSLTREAMFINAMQSKLLGNFNEAALRFNAIIKEDPNNYASYFQLAQIYFELNDFSKAEAAGQKALDLDPSDEWHYVFLGQVKVGKGDYSGASDVYEKMIQNLKTRDIELYFDYVMLLEKAEKYDKALEILSQMNQKFGPNDDVLFEKIGVYLKADRHKEAITEIKNVISKDTTQYKYYGYLGDVYEQSGQQDKAIESYNTVLKNEPDNVLAIYSLSDIYAKNGDKAKQEQLLSNAFGSKTMSVEDKVRLFLPIIQFQEGTDSVIADREMVEHLLDTLYTANSEDKDVINLINDAYLTLGEKDKAFKFLEKIIKDSNSSKEIWIQYLSVISSLGHFDTLYNSSLIAIQKFPQEPTFDFFAGFSATLIKKYKEAQKLYTEGLKKEIPNENLRLQMLIGLGDVSSQLEEYEISDDSYEKALVIEPNNALVLNNYAYYLSVRNLELNRAEKMSKKSNILDENNAAYQDTYAWIMYQKGDYNEALKWMEKAIISAGDDSSAEMYDHYGDILLKLNQKDKAIKNWEKSLEIDSNRKETTQKIQQHK